MYDLIKKYEGCSLEAYKCPNGYWTIGWGNRWLKDGTPVVEGMKITQQYADELLELYCKKTVEIDINDMGIKFTKGQREALASLIYNIGSKAFINSRLYQAIKKNNYAEICKEWDWGFKNNLKGLYKRRTEELYLFMQDI